MLIEGIPTYKTYTQMPGYDLVAVNPDKKTAARIQVKSRWASNADSFLLKNENADFVVFVLLNRGSNKLGSKIIKKQPELFVFPMDVALAARRTDDWKKVMTKKDHKSGGLSRKLDANCQLPRKSFGASELVGRRTDWKEVT